MKHRRIRYSSKVPGCRGRPIGSVRAGIDLNGSASAAPAVSHACSITHRSITICRFGSGLEGGPPLPGCPRMPGVHPNLYWQAFRQMSFRQPSRTSMGKFRPDRSANHGGTGPHCIIDRWAYTPAPVPERGGFQALSAAALPIRGTGSSWSKRISNTPIWWAPA